MSLLAQQQAVLLQALFAQPLEVAIKKVAACAVDPGSRGLKAYRSNGHVLGGRALGAAYPVLVRLLGEDSFADLARALWHACPPVAGDLALWGEELPAFMEASAQLQDTPYLADVARLEWSLHRCSTAPDAAPDPASLALLTQHDPAQLRLLLAPGLSVVCSRWPVASIFSAHVEGLPSFAEVGEMLRQQVAQDAVVWRDGLRPCVRQAAVGEARLLQALHQGQSLGNALGADAAPDFAHWFPAAVQSGLVLGVAAMAG